MSADQFSNPRISDANPPVPPDPPPPGVGPFGAQWGFDSSYDLTDARIQVHSAVSDRYRTLLLRATSVMAKFLEDTSENNRFRASYALLMMAGCFKPIPLLPAAQDESSNWPPPQLPPKVG